MILESLFNLVNDLRRRIDEHGSQVRLHETRTRYALIDPLLRELGWDTSDPSLVTPEISASGGRADYALLKSGRPVVMVEVKKLGGDLKGAVSQGIQYCLERGTQHFAVTDGQRWEVYETHRPVPIEQKKVVSFDIVQDAAGTVCLKALALWRPSVLDGSVHAGNEPVAGGTEQMPVSTPSRVSAVAPSAPVGPEWKPLDVSSLTLDADGRYIQPVEVLLPDNSTRSVKYWWEVTAAVTSWLAEKGILTAAKCPIRLGKAKRYVISNATFHSDGKPMRSPKKVGMFYLEANRSATAHVENAKGIIEHVGQDPLGFRLRFA